MERDRADRDQHPLERDDVFVAGIMEHIEEAGVHSGDSACCLPPHTLKPPPPQTAIFLPERENIELATD